ncbi:MAG: hypothetical protein AAB855_04365, partial [Patescibacteria group bacterium]
MFGEASRKLLLLGGSAGLALVCGALLVLAHWNAPPETFPVQSFFHIAGGTSVPEISHTLATQGLLRSPRLFKGYLRLLHA